MAKPRNTRQNRRAGQGNTPRRAENPEGPRPSQRRTRAAEGPKNKPGEEKLPPRQEEILRLIARHQARGMVPSAAQMAEELGLAGESSVSPQLRVLEYKGYFHIQGGVRGRQRFITLTPQARAYLKEPGYPVLARIPAGPWREGSEVERFVERLEDLLALRQGDFFLIAAEDSMEGAGILPGDWVLLRPGVQPASGEVAAVILGDEPQAVLRRVFPDVAAGTIRLQAAHPAFPERVRPAREVRVVGVMRGLVRPGRD